VRLQLCLPSRRLLIVLVALVLVAVAGALRPATRAQNSGKQWHSAGGLQEWRANYAAALLSGGRLLVVGSDKFGVGAGGVIVDPTANSWAIGPPTRELRFQQTATRLEDGRVLVTGGASRSGLAPSATEVFQGPRPGGLPISAVQMRRNRAGEWQLVVRGKHRGWHRPRSAGADPSDGLVARALADDQGALGPEAALGLMRPGCTGARAPEPNRFIERRRAGPVIPRATTERGARAARSSG
jgi:hypothetical protein